VLIVAGKQGKVRSAALLSTVEARSDGRTDSAVVLVSQDYRCAVSPRLVAGVVARSVVYDDRLEAAVFRELVEHSADLPGFVERRDDHRDERLIGLFGSFIHGRRALGSVIPRSGLLHSSAPAAGHATDYAQRYCIRI
jgi:hypothetical protein